MKRHAARIALLASVAMALGFGGAEALARPAVPGGEAQVCRDSTCARVCTTLGFRGGFCNSSGGCSCFL